MVGCDWGISILHCSAGKLFLLWQAALLLSWDYWSGPSLVHLSDIKRKLFTIKSLFDLKVKYSLVASPSFLTLLAFILIARNAGFTLAAGRLITWISVHQKFQWVELCLSAFPQKCVNSILINAPSPSETVVIWDCSSSEWLLPHSDPHPTQSDPHSTSQRDKFCI